MKKYIYLAASICSIAGMTSCSGDGVVTGTTDTTAQTSTTTTTVTRHYGGSFTPKPEVRYIDLRTSKEITVRIDTIRGEIVNAETNEPVDLFVEPVTHDTIYGITGNIVNNYVIHDPSGDFRVDTIKISNPDPSNTTTVTATTTLDAADGNYKVKNKDNKTKIKTDDVKIKEKNGVIKVKER